MTGWRRPVGLAAIAAVVIAAVVVVITMGLGGSGRPSGGHSASPPPLHPGPAAIPAPAQGAYFGAWVKPALYSQQGYLDAVTTLQQQIRRRLDIVHVYLQQDAPFPTRSERAFVRQGSMLLVSWALNDSRGIAAGEWDASIRQRAQELKALGKPVFLEWRWEMDRPNMRAEVGSPADYIAAWKHIRQVFAEQHVTNVAWVWCPTARGFTSNNAAAYYPGNDEVDWICADAYPGPGPQRSFADVVKPFLDWAAQHPKPIMIGEYGVPQSYGEQARAQWLRAAEQTVVSHRQIKALVYFDSNTTGTSPKTSFALDAGPLAVFRGIADDRYFNPRGLPVSQH
ncbi:MAG: glycoside hydrolase family 26 protein [Streptosporangiaceae bacterium]